MERGCGQVDFSGGLEFRCSFLHLNHEAQQIILDFCLKVYSPVNSVPQASKGWLNILN